MHSSWSSNYNLKIYFGYKSKEVIYLFINLRILHTVGQHERLSLQTTKTHFAVQKVKVLQICCILGLLINWCVKQLPWLRPQQVTHLVLQWREAYEAQEQLSAWGHGHRGVHSCQAVCGPRQALPQAQDSFTWRGRDNLSDLRPEQLVHYVSAF